MFNLHVINNQGQGRSYSVNWGGGGGVYSYIPVMPDGFLLKSVVFKLISKEISRADHEYMNIHPPINALATALIRGEHGVNTLENWTRISLHLSTLSVNFKSSHCILILFTIDCILLESPFSTDSAAVKPTTNFQSFAPPTSRSFIISANSQGPKFVPWGTPAGTLDHSE